MKSSEEFNIKYNDYLETGYYGNTLNNPEALEYLDKEFQELIKIPGFKYHQIKSKFNSFRCYMDNAPQGKESEIENKLRDIYNKEKI